MNSRPVIRKGDKTSHGGVVLEGLDECIIEGQPIACKGHQVSCPLCLGVYVIAEGVSNYSLGGRKPALEGMKTTCGATLIASQNTLKNNG